MQQFAKQDTHEPAVRKRMPIRLEDGTVQENMENEQSEQEISIDVPHNNELQPQNKYDFTQVDEIRQTIAKFCQSIMINPEDKSAINGLFSLIQEFDKLAQQDENMKRDVDTSLEILLKNSKDEGPLSQLRGLYNARMDQKFIALVKLCFKGHQQSYNQLNEYLSQDVQFQNHAKIITIAIEVVTTQKFNVASSIFPNLFLNAKINKVTDLVPKYKQRKQLFKKKEAAETAKSYTQKYLDADHEDNQRTFLGNLMVLVSRVLREHPECALAPGCIALLSRFGTLLNPLVFQDMISLLKLYFYQWFADTPSFDPLLRALGEHSHGVFQLKIKRQLQIQTELNQIRNYATNHSEVLGLYDSRKLLGDFHQALMVIKLIAQHSQTDCAVCLVWLLAHCYKIQENNESKVEQCLKLLLESKNGQQVAYLVRRVHKITGMLKRYAAEQAVKYDLAESSDE